MDSAACSGGKLAAMGSRPGYRFTLRFLLVWQACFVVSIFLVVRSLPGLYHCASSGVGIDTFVLTVPGFMPGLIGVCACVGCLAARRNRPAGVVAGIVAAMLIFLFGVIPFYFTALRFS